MIETTGTTFRALVSTIVLAGLTFSAGSTFGGAAPGDREEPAVVIVISDAPSEFMPGTLRIRAGDTAQWRNTGGIAHSVEFVGEILPEGTASSESGLMAPGKSYSFTFNKPGNYAYICRFHVINGMIGKIVVTSGQLTAGPTAGTL